MVSALSRLLRCPYPQNYVPTGSSCNFSEVSKSWTKVHEQATGWLLNSHWAKRGWLNCLSTAYLVARAGSIAGLFGSCFILGWFPVLASGRVISSRTRNQVCRIYDISWACIWPSWVGIHCLFTKKKTVAGERLSILVTCTCYVYYVELSCRSVWNFASWIESN